MRAAANFTANGNATGEVAGTDVDILVGGTFTASVQLQAWSNQAAAWIPIGAAITAPGVVSARFAQERRIRAQCTAFTSGTAAVELEASTDRARRITQ